MATTLHPLTPTLEGMPAPAHHAHVSLEGPQAASQRRPHIAHVLEGPHAPLRAALDRRFRLEGNPNDLITGSGIGPALIHHKRRRI
jgi:hypothetical protein